MALPDRIYGQASPKSLGGRSLFDAGTKIRPGNVVSFSSHPAVTQAAVQRLKAAGFEILQVTPTTINFAASPQAIEKLTRSKIREVEMPRPNSGSATFLDSPALESPLIGHFPTKGTPIEDVIEGIALEVPRDLMQSPVPPNVGYPHLSIPQQLADAANATALHHLGLTGAGVRVAMVDSGWYRHPYFTAQGYSVAPVVMAPGSINPDRDEDGHGTGESANIMAIAPGCLLMPVKTNFTNTIAAFNTAVALDPDIITCSWGSNTQSSDVLSAADLVLSAAVATAVARGIIVIFSAGNGHAGFPGQHPDVISVGGAIMHDDGSLEASDYASGFASRIFPGRQVPDVCGLVGMRPNAIYITLPVEPGDKADVAHSAGGVEFPFGDMTAPDDGWALFSGTSAAAPQVAGVAALLRQLLPTITPASVKQALGATARDVVTGMCSPVSGIHQGLPAGPGIDGATGPGLFDATAAVVYAYTNFLNGGLDVVTVADEASIQTAAYYQGVADAMRAAAAQWSDDPVASSYLRDLAVACSAIAHMYWTAGST